MHHSIPHPKLSLEYLIRDHQKTAVKPPLLLLLHGYGSSEHDLFDLAGDIPPEYLLISVRGPVTLSEGAYAWFPLDWSTGAPVHQPPDAEAARLKLKQFIDEVIAAFAVDPERIVMVGFSQGAIMSYSIALTIPHFIKGVAALSGRILEELKGDITKASRHSPLKVFIGHGTEDTVLPIRHAREARAYLEHHHIIPEYHEYEMPHGVTPPELSALTAWLARL